MGEIVSVDPAFPVYFFVVAAAAGAGSFTRVFAQLGQSLYGFFAS